MAIPCSPPGALIALLGGVLVITLIPRHRIAGGWYSKETMWPDEAPSPWES